MQVYRGLDIGTAKPSVEERRRVPHQLIDVVDLSESFDAAQFCRRAHEAVEDIHSRRRLPILCGGTGLYFKAFLQGLGDLPPAEPKLRAELEATPLAKLLRELAERDPATYSSIDCRNPRRVIRALEVIRSTGRPFSEQRSDWAHATCHATTPSPGGARIGDHAFFVLRRPSIDLRRRIDLRVEAMFRDGLVAETQTLLGRGLSDNRTAMQALGYRQVVEHLEGKRSLPETIELVKTKTRQFAKRQLTWFRHQFEPMWVDLAEKEPAEAIADRILASYRSSK